MISEKEYRQKLARFIPQTIFDDIDPQEQSFIKSLAFEKKFTFQEFRQVVEASRDLQMWGEGSVREWWQSEQRDHTDKKTLLELLRRHLRTLASQPKHYPEQGLERPKKREKSRVVVEQSDKDVFGMCPVASEKTVCCNLRTIDAVENCVFGCSYCTIQTFYRDTIVFDADLPEKLSRIELDPNRTYHIGTGQSSDSLAWGNRNGNLEALCAFAAEHPNVLLEFKTKSDNVRWLLDNPVPANVVCSWSMNTETIIENEEHFTATLERRIAAARAVADKGIKVAFHFHPMVWYDRWEPDYTALAHRLQTLFTPSDVLFLSFGSVTFIRPVLKKIRRKGFPTKITQMELVPDPHGKLTYPDAVKVTMFRTMYSAFSGWQDEVFMYLCMEKAEIWQQTFGRVFPSNDEFEREFAAHCMQKIYGHATPPHVLPITTP